MKCLCSLWFYIQRNKIVLNDLWRDGKVLAWNALLWSVSDGKYKHRCNVQNENISLVFIVDFIAILISIKLRYINRWTEHAENWRIGVSKNVNTNVGIRCNCVQWEQRRAFALIRWFCENQWHENRNDRTNKEFCVNANDILIWPNQYLN